MIGGMGRLFLLFALADLAILAIALIDCLSSEGYEIRALPKPVWVLLILLFSPIGGIAWFVAGRPRHDEVDQEDSWRPGKGFSVDRGRRQLAPDDDPEFLRSLAARPRREDEETLRRWEEDLRRREDELRRRKSDDGET
jgi:hypothetical protein